MKTTNQNKTQKHTLGDSANQPAQFKAKPEQETAQGAPAQTAEPRQDNRLPIDLEARKQNRSLDAATVLMELKRLAPVAFNVAQVVGKWVWVQFKDQPARETRQALAQLGFHWNNTRQTWQHPCGKFSFSSKADPREKYAAQHPDQLAA